MITATPGIVDISENHLEYTMFASDHSDTRRGFPMFLDTDLGNGMPFKRSTKKVDADGDILYVRYNQSNGALSLVVFND